MNFKADAYFVFCKYVYLHNNGKKHFQRCLVEENSANDILY